MKKQQLLYLIVAFIFVIFAIIQYNDPDFYIWIPVYAWVAILYYLAFQGKFLLFWNAITGLLVLVWIFLYFPSFFEWISKGSHDIMGSMKAESPYIEQMREFLGLILCFLALLYLYFRARKKSI